jgi:putative endonuclease
MLSPKQKGLQAENLAKKHLQNKGYQFIAQNVHSRYGEIDLIFVDHGQLVFVEVKQRKTGSQVDPASSITAAKLDKILLTANYFMLKNPSLPQFGRIDAVMVGDEGQIIGHLQNISQ